MIWVVVAAICSGLSLLGMNFNSQKTPEASDVVTIPSPVPSVVTAPDRLSPSLLTGRSFYNDPTRTVAQQATQLQDNGDSETARLLRIIADQPGTSWLTGPTDSDPQAERDITLVARTSAEAAAQGKVAVYQLYAIPRRDACAAYSKGGFTTGEAYLNWVDRIIAALAGEAIISVEADAIAQTVMGSCLDQAQTDERYALLKTTIEKLNASPYVLAAYLDAGHSEWITSPAQLVAPLKASGIDMARGIAVNVSNFVPTTDTVSWVEELVALLGGDKKAIIDTSRNGRGSPPASVTGDARWCNPAGRGIGQKPTTTSLQPVIDALVWIKNVGESDGNCNGNPDAGVFSVELARELAQNAL